MSTTIPSARDINLAAILGESPAEPAWLRWVDRVATRAGDAINPILVKETRQALKSRQFVVTFSLLLFAAFAWTIVGSLLMMPQIYFQPSAPTMLTGYYLVLAVPMLLVVPLAAYRSLEGEIDDGTLELLSVTSLTPSQIVLGKLGSAALQMMLYFVALFPCVAYAYSLRGVDLPTLGVLMSMLIIFGLTLTVVAIFFAPMATVRSSQVSTLLMVMAFLMAGEFATGTIAFALIQGGNPLTASQTGFVLFAVLMFTTTFAAVLLMATAAQLTPESENRSTGIRISLLVHQLAVVVIASMSLSYGFAIAGPLVAALTAHLLVTWAAAGSMMSAESPTMTPRIRRELPGTLMGRLLFVWFTPGPATGMIFALVNLGVAIFVMGQLHDRVTNLPDAYWLGLWWSKLQALLLLTWPYLCVAFIGVRAIISVLRSRNTVRAGVGMAALAVVLLLMALVPYSIGLHLNDYRPYAYSDWQLTNWIWTMNLAITDQLPRRSMILVIGIGAFAFIANLLFLGRVVLPQRLVTPKRVIEERQARRRQSSRDAITMPADPLGLGTEPESI